MNKYVKVVKIYNSNNNDCDSIVVTDSTVLSVGDTIIIYQAKGAGWNDTSGFSDGSYGFAGRFEYHIILKKSGDTLILLSNLAGTEGNKFDAENNVQAIKVPSYVNFDVQNTLTVPAWNGNTGGVFAIIVSNTM